MPGANDIQIGGEHYKSLKPEPWDVIAAWELDYFAGSAVAYLARYKRKDDPLGDLNKAKHYIEKLIELEHEKAINEGIARLANQLTNQLSETLDHLPEGSH